MFRWVRRCGACAVVLIHGEVRARWNGCGRLVKGAGRRLVGWWGFGGGGEVQAGHLEPVFKLSTFMADSQVPDPPGS